MLTFCPSKGFKLLPFEHLCMLSIATVWWHVIENSLNFQFKIIYCHQMVKFNFPPQHRCCLCVKNVEHTTVMKFRKKKNVSRAYAHTSLRTLIIQLTHQNHKSSKISFIEISILWGMNGMKNFLFIRQIIEFNHNLGSHSRSSPLPKTRNHHRDLTNSITLWWESNCYDQIGEIMIHTNKWASTHVDDGELWEIRLKLFLVHLIW